MYKTYVCKYFGCQARAPSSPVIVVGTHSDKMTSMEQQVELNESLKQIIKLYGDCNNQIEGTYIYECICCYHYVYSWMCGICNFLGNF